MLRLVQILAQEDHQLEVWKKATHPIQCFMQKRIIDNYSTHFV